MTEGTDSQTSTSLLELLRQDPRNAQAWLRFVKRYRPKIYGWCREWGLQGADAEDVAQDVLAKLTAKMAHFQYDPSRCFRAWLKTVTRRALSDAVASRGRSPRGDDPRVLGTLAARAGSGPRAGESFDFELVEVAMLRVRQRVAPSTWEAFRLTAIEGLSGAEASQRLLATVASIFVAKHRVQKMLREEIRRLEDAAEF